MSIKTNPTHLPDMQFPVANNCLLIGGKTVTELADQAGQTPFYVYDSNLVSDRIKKLKKQLPEEIHLHYAMKANPMPELVNFVATRIDGLDVASGGELRIALDSGMEPSKISFAGPGKRKEELMDAVVAGITINAESETELDRISKLGIDKDIRPRVAIRVNPDFELKTSGMKMGGRPTQFGIDAERVPEVLRNLTDKEIQFMGFHIFSGSQNLKSEAIIDSQQKTFKLALELARHAPSSVRLLNIGGGFGIPYFQGDSALDIKPIAQNLRQCLPEVIKQLPDAEIVIELGRYLVGEAGAYVCKVVDKKKSKDQLFAITDGGLHHHLAASGNFGQVLRKNYPVLVGNRITDEETEVVNIVGPLCTPLDILGSKMELPKIRIGDLIVVLQSGAYGLSASPTAFLGHPAPQEILI